MMTDEQFAELNPVIMDNIKAYDPQWKAYIVQGKFLKTHTFILDVLEYKSLLVLMYRCGLMDGKYWTLQNLANHFGISKQRVQQLESDAWNKLRNPYRIKLLKKYDDKTFNKENHTVFLEGFKSLITQDIVTHMTKESLADIEDIKISELDITDWGNLGARMKVFKQQLANNGIITCNDLIVYLQEHGDLSYFEIDDLMYKRLIEGVCDLVEGYKAKQTSKQVMDKYIVNRTEMQNLADEEYLKLGHDPRYSIKNRDERLANAVINPENVLLEDLGLSLRVYSILRLFGFKTLKDIIVNYKSNKNSIRYIQHMGPKSEKEIINRLRALGIELELDIDAKRKMFALTMN
ncbi:MAG: sigma factor-like helix-turn-helix DNA-binding protein [Clostridia bacterium]